MHIGLLTTSFPRFEGDIAGSFVLGFARALAARGHSLTVLAPEPSERVAASSFAAIAPGPAAPITVRHVPYLWPRRLSRTFYGAGVADNVRDPRAWPGLATYPPSLWLAAVRGLDGCDALVSHFGVPCGWVGSQVRGTRRHVAVLHSADLRALQRLPFGARLAHALVRGADHVTCVSARARAGLLALLPTAHRAELARRIHVQAMGTDALALERALPARARAREQLGASGLTLLTLARLVPIKGLLEALEMLGPREDVEWIIAGDGPLRAELQRRAASARARVRLVGEVHGDDKLQLLAAADALLMPSLQLPSGRAEGAPLAILEAMAAGLPVIASSTGGIPELLDFGRAGALFDPREPATLHAALAAVQVEPEREQRLARAREIAFAHDWSIVGERYERWITGA
jgi:glycosyltransferase involved in cell wall biosynthesis